MNSTFVTADGEADAAEAQVGGEPCHPTRAAAPDCAASGPPALRAHLGHDGGCRRYPRRLPHRYERVTFHCIGAGSMVGLRWGSAAELCVASDDFFFGG